MVEDHRRINEEILSPRVRVIDDKGEQLGILSLRDALNASRERELDLVEVAPNADPPVCRILDYGKYHYTMVKRMREARKAQKITEIKEIRLRPKTDDYHTGFKVKRARDFLKQGMKVKVRVQFRGREITHPEIGLEHLREVAAEHHLDAVTVRCFDLVTSAYTSGCLALSALNDRGVVAGCEGDVAATMALLWFRQLFGRIGQQARRIGDGLGQRHRTEDQRETAGESPAQRRQRRALDAAREQRRGDAAQCRPPRHNLRGLAQQRLQVAPAFPGDQPVRAGSAPSICSAKPRPPAAPAPGLSAARRPSAASARRAKPAIAPS